MKKKVSERALMARINRKLAREQQQLMKCKQDSRDHAALGDYYLVDLATNSITAQNMDLGDLGRELECLAGYEELV